MFRFQMLELDPFFSCLFQCQFFFALRDFCFYDKKIFSRTFSLLTGGITPSANLLVDQTWLVFCEELTNLTLSLCCIVWLELHLHIKGTLGENIFGSNLTAAIPTVLPVWHLPRYLPYLLDVLGKMSKILNFVPNKMWGIKRVLNLWWKFHSYVHILHFLTPFLVYFWASVFVE